MAAQVYEVPVVSHSLRPAETYTQLCQALQTLQATATAIFERVENRVESERGRLRAISSRIRSAEAQIASLAGSTKAITIYSSAKYPPAQQHNTDYGPIFGIRTPQRDGLHQKTLGALPFAGDWRDRPQGTEEALELFRFFSATANQAGTEVKQVGRPRLPPDLQSTSNLLLFDSSESIFDKPSASSQGRSQQERTQGAQKRKEAKQKAARKEVRSIIHGDAVAVDDSEEFAFRPTLEAVPALDLPTVLPNLPMIADISWTGGQDGVEAAPPLKAANPPSVHRRLDSASSRRPSSTSNSSNTSAPKPHRPAPNTDVRVASGSSASSEPTQPPPQSHVPPQNAPPAAPKGPHVSSAVASSTVDTVQGRATGNDAKPQTLRSLSPPPVPPPAPPLPKREVSPPVPAGDPARRALLESIRNPGVQLRKVSEGRSRTPSPRKELMAAVREAGVNEGSSPRGRSASSPPPKGDMFAEMASQLMNRRLSMKGGLQSVGKEEAASNSNNLVASPASPTRESEPLPQRVPMRTPNLAALVAQRSMKRPSAGSDDEDEEEWGD